MLDHFGVGVADYDRAKTFYTTVLAPLGAELMIEIPQAQVAGFGRDGKPDFWISAKTEPQSSLHIAIAARNRGEVDAFYAAALGAGARDNGAPGLRPDYHPNYYGAFVIDPEGHNFEAVCHAPE